MHTWSEPGEYSFAKDFHVVQFGSTDAPDDFGSIQFQDGPVTEHGENGTTNEEVLKAVIERLQALNQAPFNCRENSLAITHLEEALHWLWTRTKNRQERGVEGTSTP